MHKLHQGNARIEDLRPSTCPATHRPGRRAAARGMDGALEMLSKFRTLTSSSQGMYSARTFDEVAQRLPSDYHARQESGALTARHNERARAALARLDSMDRHTERGGSSCLMEETKLQFEAHERRINAILQDINSLFGSEPAAQPTPQPRALPAIKSLDKEKDTSRAPVPLIRSQNTDAWWLEAIKRAHTLPRRGPRSNNVTVKLDLLRLNPTLLQEVQDRAAGGQGGETSDEERASPEHTHRQRAEFPVELATQSEIKQRIWERADRERERVARVQQAKQALVRAEEKRMADLYKQRHPDPVDPEVVRRHQRQATWATVVALLSRVKEVQFALKCQRQIREALDAGHRAAKVIQRHWRRRQERIRQMKLMKIGLNINFHKNKYMKGLRKRMKVEAARVLLAYIRDQEHSNVIIRTVLTYRRAVLILQKYWRSRCRIYDSRRGILLKQWNVFEQQKRKSMQALPQSSLFPGSRKPVPPKGKKGAYKEGSRGNSQVKHTKKLPKGRKIRSSNHDDVRTPAVPHEIKIRLVEQEIRKFQSEMIDKLHAWSKKMAQYHSKLAVEEARMSLFRHVNMKVEPSKPPPKPHMQTVMKPHELEAIHEKGCKIRDMELEFELAAHKREQETMDSLKEATKDYLLSKGYTSTEIAFKNMM